MTDRQALTEARKELWRKAPAAAEREVNLKSVSYEPVLGTTRLLARHGFGLSIPELAEVVAAGVLRRQHAHAALVEAAIAAGLSWREAERTIHSAFVAKLGDQSAIGRPIEPTTTKGSQ
jgi:hypothetical protein